MEMIERYIYAVTQKLPQSQREDIAVELRGLIEDMIEERVQDKEAMEKDVEEVLMELGNPRNLAQKYRGTKKFLIGPELFDSYILVLKIVLISVAFTMAISFLIQIIIEPISILDHFIDLIVSTVTAIPMAFGWTTFGFALAERFGEINQVDLQMDKDWKPSDLAPIPDPKGRIKRGDPIAGIIFYVFFIVFFSFSTNYFGIWIFNDGYRGTIPFINEEVNNIYLLLIILILLFGVLKESLKLIYGKWTSQLVLFSAIVNFISFIAVVLLISEPGFWNPDLMNGLVQQDVLIEGSEAYEIVTTIWQETTKWMPILVAIGLVWDVIDGVIKVKRSKAK
ncbi:HAAS signaling domain-containing protein [Oceanobacillus bengalensis]|uniref:Uncharacterized protein n=1 Tax=Oceanobacillus bengalensis TaxID=1435466 RepID=A0A494Z2S5_9BACI|nr:hypothetical protein [Oceanobacillus bengalensis]RKQ16783.1 hypothetical protein D8M05_05895 [Oceanobacillus bengalensis]